MNSNDSQETNEQILNDIQTLQTMEQQLFRNLENNPNLTTQQQKEIVQKMNQISNMRINLYQTLSGVNNYYQNALNSSQGTLKEQTAAIYIVENELNNAKRRLEALDVEKMNKVRLVEINNYYGDKYAEHGSLMKIIIFTLIPVIILALLNRSGILPAIIYYILVIIIAAIGGYFFWLRFGSIITRDNMNYQEYDWYFDASAAPSGTATSTSDPWASLGSMGTCVGQACCSDGQLYDETIDQCVGSSTATPSSTDTYAAPRAAPRAATRTTTESFVTEGMIEKMLTKTEQGKHKADVVYKGNTSIQPNISESFIYKN